ncbi:MAG: hypothetical protein MZV64_16755 [Ignavibacteriales bacterium]|nr:hypothetical protein [Ignavibacteriales bacterium]
MPGERGQCERRHEAGDGSRPGAIVRTSRLHQRRATVIKIDEDGGVPSG